MSAMTATQKKNAEAIASLCCIVCRQLGYEDSPAEIHHVRIGNGMSQRNHNKIIPLCPLHHRLGGYGVAIHAGQKIFEKRYGTELHLMEQTKKLLEGAA